MKSTFAQKTTLALLSLAGLFLAAPKARGDEADPPTRVARISYLDGSVSFQPSGTEEWAAAAKNRPVTIGDKIWTDKDSRAELQAGQASLHLGSMTALSFLNLDENIIQMRVAEGAVNFRVRELHEGDLYEVDTPNLAFIVKEAGAFRIDVDENGENTRVVVIRGEGEITAGGKTYDVRAGELAELSGVEDPEFRTEQAPRADGLDRWAADRDLKEEHSVSARYVSRDVPGYSDLDDYGTWREEPEYGHVWYPRAVEVGWAPYSYGYWNWVGPWGWTWVDYSPWGFAPYHYGRWQFIGDAWGWCPGPIYATPYYGPAFVGFVGGGGWSVGVGFGGGWGANVGWFPLGWGEPYNPWFNCSHTFINNVNINNTYIRNVNVLNANSNYSYAYARNVRAVTATTRESFVSGQRVSRGVVSVNDASLRNAHVSNSVALTPTRASFTGAASTNVRVATPPATALNRSVVARTAPAAAASHIPVRAVNNNGLQPARGGNVAASGAVGTRAGANLGPRNGSPNASVDNRAPSANGNFNARASAGTSASTSPNRPNTNTRNWGAQGNTTDRGRAPQGFNQPSSNRPNGALNGGPNGAVNSSNQPARANRSDRPSWAGSGGPPSSSSSRSSAPSYNNNRPAQTQSRPYEPPARSNAPANNNRPPSLNNNQAPSRSYEPPTRPNNNRPPASYSNQSNGSRSYEAPSRSYTAPSRSYSPPQGSNSAPSRSYSPPDRGYSAPQRSYSAPSQNRSYSAPAPSRSYSAPSYSAPSRSYSAPSPSRGGGGSYSGGGGSRSGGGGGGSPHSGGGGGGSPRGGGGSHGH